MRTPDLFTSQDTEPECLTKSHITLCPGTDGDFEVSGALMNLLRFHSVPSADMYELGAGSFNPGRKIRGIHTLPIVQECLKLRMDENYSTDTKWPGRGYSRLNRTEVLKVCPAPYETVDKFCRIDALRWPRTTRPWMPDAPSEETDVPLCEVDARYLESLARTILRAANVQAYGLEAIQEWFRSNCADVLTRDKSVPKNFLVLQSRATTDIIKLAVEILVSIVNLRRDVLLQHSLLSPFIALWHRNRAFSQSSSLFRTADIKEATECLAKHLKKAQFKAAAKVLPGLKM